jgi:hypothetical protein
MIDEWKAAGQSISSLQVLGTRQVGSAQTQYPQGIFHRIRRDRYYSFGPVSRFVSRLFDIGRFSTIIAATVDHKEAEEKSHQAVSPYCHL